MCIRLDQAFPLFLLKYVCSHSLIATYLSDPAVMLNRVWGPVYAFALSYVSTPAELASYDGRQQAHYRLILLVSCLCGVTSLPVLAALWYVLDATYTAMLVLIPFCICGVGVVYWKFSHRIGPARLLVVYGTLGASLSWYWSLGGNVNSVGVITMGFVAPHLCMVSGSSLAHAALVHALVVGAVVLFTVLEVSLGSVRYTPQATQIPPQWQSVLLAFHITFCSTLSLAFGMLSLSQLRAKTASLERSLTRAETLAQKIAAFDVNDITDERSEDRILDLMIQVANNLKAYRPYLPPHLFMSDDDAQDDDDHPHPHRVPSSLPSPQSACLPSGQSVDTRSSSTTTTKSSSPHFGRYTALSHHARHDLAHGVVGTLMYIRVNEFERLVNPHDGGAAALPEISGIFAQVVVHFVGENKGVIHSLGHDRCMVSWNLLPRCHLHVAAALSTALEIREEYGRKVRAFSPAAGPLARLSIGVWTGPLHCSCVGTQDFKTFAFSGRGCTAVVALQQYAAAFGRCIVANARAFALAASAPQHRLLPVDVLATAPDAAGPDGRARGEPGSEVVYECVAALQTSEDEWMYQLQECTASASADEQLNKLLATAQAGLPPTKRAHAQFLEGVSDLEQGPDPWVSHVARHLRKVAEQHLQRGPYRRGFCDPWSLEPYYEPMPLTAAKSKTMTFEGFNA